jgi:hypothetical protein
VPGAGSGAIGLDVSLVRRGTRSVGFQQSLVVSDQQGVKSNLR